MRRTAAALAVTLAASVALGGPLAMTSQAESTPTLHCATAAPPPACALLDDLAAALEPASPILGPALAPLTVPAAGFAARSDQSAGVPVAEVLTTAQALLAALDALPAPVAGLLGPAGLDSLTTPLEGLVAELTAPVSGGQQSAGTSKATPAKTSAAPAAPRSTSARTSTTSTSGSSKPSAPAPTSSAKVPDVPVGDPLILAPLAMPDFEVANPALPVPAAPAPASAEVAQVAAEQAALDALGDSAAGAELAVVVALSILLLVGAGLAKVHQDRHVIPES
jgi:hypothetical protein